MLHVNWNCQIFFFLQAIVFDHTYAFAYLFEQFSIYFFKWARCTTIALKRVRTISLFPHSLYLLLGYSFKVAHEPFPLLQHIYPQLTIKPSSLHSGILSPGPHFPCLSWSTIVRRAVCAISICPPHQSHKDWGGRKHPAFRCWIANCSWVSLLPSTLPLPREGQGGRWKQPYILFSALENKRFTPEAFHSSPEAPLQTT